MQTDPLLRNYYHSVGIEIYYEIIHSSGDNWHFENLSKILHEHGFAINSEPTLREYQPRKAPPRYDAYTNSYETQAR